MRLVTIEEDGIKCFIDVTEIVSVMTEGTKVFVILRNNSSPISISFGSEDRVKSFCDTVINLKKRGL